ncbi:helix-turn-helix domain-containing protein [Fulvivirgaceae bacterium BMA10]|uniref:Helix-turn-helix domain-containing protein n=1 Tax=Splendidivirga corallicola TaxID=3051826 RepID=A0ABT8KRV8_9BACT|nr:helix-turn-helix domain-containing protein [Fulvivirgaceae bacterium BMA10]
MFQQYFYIKALVALIVMTGWSAEYVVSQIPQPVFKLDDADNIPAQPLKESTFQAEIITDPSVGKCFYFNGSDQYLNLGSHNIGSGFTISLWFRSDDLLSHNATLIDIGGVYWIRTTTQREIQFTRPLRGDHNSEGQILTEDIWYQFTLVVDGSRALNYLNGQLIASYQIPGKLRNELVPIVLGKNSWREYYSGKMSNIFFWDIALKKNQVQGHYRRTRKQTPLHDNLITYLPLDNADHFGGYDGTPEFSAVSFLEDKHRGVVANFDSTGSYIDFGEIEIDNAITISAWIKPERSGRHALIGSGHVFAFRTNYDNRLLFTIPQVMDINSQERVIEPGKWQHVAVTYHEGKAVFFYHNGQLVSMAEVEEYQQGAKKMRIANNLWNDTYSGEMDDILIWNRILTPAEIRDVSRMSSASLQSILIETDHQIFEYAMTFAVFGLLGGWLVYTYKRKWSTSGEKIPGHKINDEFLQKAKETTIRNMSQSTFGVEGFAEAMGMSKTSLYSYLKSACGKSPKEFIREERLNKAADLILTTTRNISEITFSTGFESRAYFNKCFREKYGMTPTEFRQKNQ